jgi:hypothetical protein
LKWWKPHFSNKVQIKKTCYLWLIYFYIGSKVNVWEHLQVLKILILYLWYLVWQSYATIFLFVSEKKKKNIQHLKSLLFSLYHSLHILIDKPTLSSKSFKIRSFKILTTINVKSIKKGARMLNTVALYIWYDDD